MNAIAAVVASGTTPADLSNVVLWVEAASGTVRVASDGTGAAMSNGQAVGRWIRPGDSLTSPAFPYATQLTAGDKPPLEIASSRYWLGGGSSDRLAISPAVVLTDDFLLLAVVKSVFNGAITILGHSTLAGLISVSDEGFIKVANLVTNNTTSVGYSAGLALIRVRRVSNTVYVASTGVPEESLGTLSGTITFDTVLAAPGEATETWTDESLSALVISTNAGHAASPPSYIDGPTGYFKTSTANVAAAWGVSL